MPDEKVSDQERMERLEKSKGSPRSGVHSGDKEGGSGSGEGSGSGSGSGSSSGGTHKK